MAIMNRKAYWKARNLFNKCIFRVKVWLFNAVNKVDTFLEYKSFRGLIIRNTLKSGIISIFIAAGVLFIDKSLLKILQYFVITGIPFLDQSIIVDVVIGSIGVTGVILGLYCANISSIYTTRYANAPEKIAQAFQLDSLTHKCMSSIITFIIFGFVVIFETLLGFYVGWATLTTIIIWAIIVLISYSIAGNRSYQLSDIYRLADDSYRFLYRTISKRLRRIPFSSDISFQKHFLKEAEKRIDLLKVIQKYGANEDHGDNTTMVEFMNKNLMLIETYWIHKITIEKNSLWFRNEAKYKKWHLSNSTETMLALHTGTALRTKNEPNYWWFEDELMEINHSCLKVLMDKRDYSSFYTYLLYLERLCEFAISHNEINYYAGLINRLKNLIEIGKENGSNEKDNSDARKIFVGIVEIVSLLYLDLILCSSKYYERYNIGDITATVIRVLNSGHPNIESLYLRKDENTDFYEKIITEIKVEGYRLTPDWLIKQYIAKSEYDYLNRLIETIRDGIDQSFSLGQSFFEKGLLFEAYIMLSKFYEYESKLNRFLEIVQIFEQELKALQVDKDMKWEKIKTAELLDTFKKWKTDLPDLLSKCSSKLTLDIWEKRDEYPDFLGESFNHVCEDAVESIVNDNTSQFEQDFLSLSKMMLLYQEYIRTDFLKERNKYRIEYAYYTYTFPIVEWAQIGGLAILWGEFSSDITWQKMVGKAANTILTDNGLVTDLAEKMVQYIQQRDQFMFWFDTRGVLETQWNQSVANAIKHTNKVETEYAGFTERLKTSSKLLKAFCDNFMDMGFTEDPSEVFWVMCVNPLLPKEKQFHTRFNWEDALRELSDIS